jgi:prepilin-type N-terminal cleavage/methylation domain-containing protein
METAMKIGSNTRSCRPTNQGQRGFTMLEVMISIVVVTVGLMSLLAAFSVAMASTQTAKQDMIAKQLAQEAMESIITARETANADWTQIQNVGPGNGIFVTGFQSIRQAGPDGVIGTADDSGAPMATTQEPGPDGIVGTADDPAPVPLTNYKRSIVIAPGTSADLRTVTITVRYSTRGNATRSYVLSGIVSQYR